MSSKTDHTRLLDLKAWRRDASAKADVLLAAAGEARTAGQIKKAVTLLTQGITGIERGYAVEPEVSVRFYEQAGLAALAQGAHGQALKLFQTALDYRMELRGESHLERGIAHLHVGRVLRLLGRVRPLFWEHDQSGRDDALWHLTAAASLIPSDHPHPKAEAHWELALCYRELEWSVNMARHSARALRFMARLATETSEAAEIICLLAEALIDHGKYRWAQKLLTSACAAASKLGFTGVPLLLEALRLLALNMFRTDYAAGLALHDEIRKLSSEFGSWGPLRESILIADLASVDDGSLPLPAQRPRRRRLLAQAIALRRQAGMHDDPRLMLRHIRALPTHRMRYSANLRALIAVRLLETPTAFHIIASLCHRAFRNKEFDLSILCAKWALSILYSLPAEEIAFLKRRRRYASSLEIQLEKIIRLGLEARGRLRETEPFGSAGPNKGRERTLPVFTRAEALARIWLERYLALLTVLRFADTHNNAPTIRKIQNRVSRRLKLIATQDLASKPPGLPPPSRIRLKLEQEPLPSGTVLIETRTEHEKIVVFIHGPGDRTRFYFLEHDPLFRHQIAALHRYLKAETFTPKVYRQTSRLLINHFFKLLHLRRRLEELDGGPQPPVIALSLDGPLRDLPICALQNDPGLLIERSCSVMAWVSEG